MTDLLTQLQEARESLIEAMCLAFVQEADGVFPDGVWPGSPGDDGHRGDGSYVRLLSENDQHEIRCAMGFALDEVAAFLLARQSQAQEGGHDV